MVELNELNDAQREAVTCIDAPSLVIAGAGSGKTRVLTYKIAYLLEQGFQPWNILALTFTNKAAREMQQRIARQVSPELANNLWMGTFHSIFSRILRIESQSIGFTSNFTIYDAADQKSLVRTILREMGLDEKQYKPGTVCSRISEAKNRLIFPNQYMNDPHAQQRDNEQRMPSIGQIYLRYMQRCRLSDAMDFDDLLLYTFYLFDRFPEVCKKYEGKFHFVLVDEYQDTNYAQHRIVWQLTQHRQRVCVVGDDAQSIYSFRGANIDNILHFQEMYQGARLFKLERNYRSTQNIVKAANSLIAHNRGQIHKDVYSEKVEGTKVKVFTTASDYEESALVASRIQQLARYEHVAYKDMAILYRTNSQSRSLEEALRREHLPYRIYGGLSFYQRKEIKDVIAYLRLSLNPRDEEALKRIINYPARGIGDTTLQRVLTTASSAGVSPWQVLIDTDSYQLQANNGTKGKLKHFAEMIQQFHAQTSSADAYTVAKTIVLESGLSADINKGTEPDDITRQENLRELMDGMAAFVEEQREQGEPCLLTDYLQRISLLSDLDEDNGNKQAVADSDDKVTLMTVHSAKGLEFRIVFVVGLEENLFPNQMAIEEGLRGLEEERRLMYVAMTRAEEQLFLTNAHSRFRFGKTELTDPSRFLREIDRSYLSLGASADDEAPHFRSSSSSAAGDTPRFRSSSSSAAGDTHSFRSSGSSAAGDAPRFPQGTSSYKPTFTKLQGRPFDAGNYTPAAPVIPATARPLSSLSPRSTAASTAAASSADIPELKVGNLIEHGRFGVGVVEAVEGRGIDTKATVKFDNVGTKQLLIRFAKIKVIR